MDITEIITLILKVICFICVCFIIPYVKKKYTHQQLEEINDKIQTYVEAAEQIFGSEQGEEKKQWVRSRLAAAGINVDLDEIDAAIEAFVLLLHAELRKE